MNIRNHLIELQCSQREVADVSQALIHSLIFFRTHGKFNYKHEGSYSVGTLGFERVTCNHLDLSYIRCSSSSLINRVDTKVQELVEKLNEYSHYITIALEFYTRRPNRWPFNDSKIVWELWNIKIVINSNNNNNNNNNCSNPTTTIAYSGSPNLQQYNNNNINNYHHQQQQPRLTTETSNRVEDLLSAKLLDIIRIVNADKCTLPAMPTQPNLENIFDTSHNELQPYLYNLSYKISESLPGAYHATGGSPKTSDGLVTDSSTQSSLKKFLLGTLEL